MLDNLTLEMVARLTPGCSPIDKDWFICFGCLAESGFNISAPLGHHLFNRKFRDLNRRPVVLTRGAAEAERYVDEYCDGVDKVVVLHLSLKGASGLWRNVPMQRWA